VNASWTIVPKESADRKPQKVVFQPAPNVVWNMTTSNIERSFQLLAENSTGQTEIFKYDACQGTVSFEIPKILTAEKSD